MADIEQGIKIKIKAVLEGFDSLKSIKKDIKDAFSEAATNDFTVSVKNAENANKSFASSVKEVIRTGANIAEITSGIIRVLEFFGVTGAQVKAAVVTAFNSIKSAATGLAGVLQTAFNSIKTAITGALSSAASAGGGIVASLSAMLSSLTGALSAAIPALLSAGGGVIAFGAIAGAITGVVLALTAAVASLVVAAGGIALAGTVGSAALLALASSGFEYNAAIETITLGTGALIAQLSEIRRNGLKLEGAEAVEAGIELAQEQLAKLRVDAIQTTATFEELANVYQAAVGSGLGAGLDLDQIRQITVSLAQAGAALGVPYDQMRQEVNSILEGTIDINSRIAKNLGITNEEVKAYKQKGTLAEELNKKLVAFNAAGIKAAQTLNGLKSNLQEALNVFSGEATTKAFETLKARLSTLLGQIFDFKAAGLDKAFKPLAELIDKTLVDAINRFADFLETAVSLAKDLGKFLSDNSKTLDDILNLADGITREVVGIVADMLGLTGSTENWKKVLELIRSILKTVQGALVSIRSIAQGIYKAFALAGGAVNVLSVAVDGLINQIPGLRQLVDLLFAVAGATAAIGAASTDKGSTDGLLGGLSDGLASAFGVDGVGNPTDAKKGGLSYKGNKTPGDKKKKGGGGKDKAAQIADAKDGLEQTRIDAGFNEFMANLRKEETALEDSYKNRLISTDKYFADKQRLAKKTLDAEIAKERYLLELAQAKQGRAKDSADRLQAQADVEAIESRINVLVTEVGEKETEINRQKAEAIKELTLQYDELRNVLNEIEGLGYEATSARIEEKYRELLERATADGNQEVIELIGKIKNHERVLAKIVELEKGYTNALSRREDELEKIQELIESGAINEEQAGLRRIAVEREYKGELLDVVEALIARARAAKEFDKVIALTAAKRKIEASGSFTTPELLDRERAKFERLKASLSNKNRTVDNQVDRGDITPELGDKRRLENERALKAELTTSVNLMRELAKATASLDDDLAVENLALEIDNLGVATDTLGKGIIDALRDGIGGFFDDLISGTQSLTQSFKSMVSSILASIARLAANELLKSLFSSGLFKSGGGLGFLSGLKFADGGHISGRGTGTSDSIPIMASNGEFMIKAATVRKFGVGFLNRLNSGNVSGLFGKFAAGGAIGSNPMNAGQTSGSMGWQGNIYNVLDPALLKDYLTTSSGQNTILNVIKRNPEIIKTYLR